MPGQLKAVRADCDLVVDESVPLCITKKTQCYFELGPCEELTATTTVRIGKTWALAGPILEASGNIDYINGFYVSLGTGQSAEIVGCTYSIQDGSSCVVRLQQNGIDITGDIMVNTTSGTTSIGPIALNTNDRIDLVVQSVDNVAINLSFTVFIEHTTPIVYS